MTARLSAAVRRFVTQASLLGVLLAPSCAWASGALEQCLTAAQEGQVVRDQGKFHAARAAFLVCADERCPALVRADCTRWEEALEATFPTLAIRATEEGHDVPEVRVFCDGKPLAERLDGKPIEIDPGSHVLAFERDGRRQTRQIVVVAGEKNRALVIDFPRFPPVPVDSARAAEVAPARASVLLPAALGAVGVLGLASFTYFAVRGSTELQDLHAGCAPDCPHDDVVEAKRLLAVGDISLGVGVVALGFAAWLWLSSPPASRAVRPLFAPGPGGSFSGFVKAF